MLTSTSLLDMFPAQRSRLPSTSRDDRGFTLVETLVVMLIIGLLVAISILVMRDQREKAQDVDAKSNATSLARFVEACYIESSDYRDCETVDLGTNTGLPLGTGVGQVDVASGASNEFMITAYSRSGGRFTIETTGAYSLRRGCDDASAGCNAPDASSNKW